MGLPSTLVVLIVWTGCCSPPWRATTSGRPTSTEAAHGGPEVTKLSRSLLLAGSLLEARLGPAQPKVLRPAPRCAGSSSALSGVPRLLVSSFRPGGGATNTPAQAGPFFPPSLLLEERGHALALHFPGAQRCRSVKCVEVHRSCLRLSIGRASSGHTTATSAPARRSCPSSEYFVCAFARFPRLRAASQVPAPSRARRRAAQPIRAGCWILAANCAGKRSSRAGECLAASAC